MAGFWFLAFCGKPMMLSCASSFINHGAVFASKRFAGFQRSFYRSRFQNYSQNSSRLDLDPSESNILLNKSLRRKYQRLLANNFLSIIPSKAFDNSSRHDLLYIVTTAVLSTCGLFLYFLNQPGNGNSVKALTPNISNRNFIADIVRKAGPAVVFVEIKGKHPVSGQRITLANGSGFIVRNNGLILTNAHVVENKVNVIVRLHDGSTYDGVVTVVDPVSDLATIKIEPDKKLPVIPLGKSSRIRPGEFVAAMGSPLSLHKTVTVGIVSSPLRRSQELGLSNMMDYIQTDAVIGLGNSGGPLVNLDGQAIGINTLKLTEGISFAIPSDYAQKVLQRAEASMDKVKVGRKPSYLPNGQETSRRRYMGITMLPLSPAIVLELKDKNRELPDITHGVYVHKVVVSSPAYSGGVHAGDIIVEINGAKIQSAADVYKMVEKSDLLQMTVIRGKYSKRFSIITEAL